MLARTEYPTRVAAEEESERPSFRFAVGERDRHHLPTPSAALDAAVFVIILPIPHLGSTSPFTFWQVETPQTAPRGGTGTRAAGDQSGEPSGLTLKCCIL